MDISIIIPVYNAAPYLKKCLESVRRGIGSLTAEVLLVDDGSVDESAAIAKEFCRQDPDFHYFYVEHGGLSRARNFGEKMAKGKYLHFVDSDDVTADHIFEEMYRTAENTGADMVICDAARIREEKVTASAIHLRAFHDLEEPVTHITRQPALVYDSTIWNKLIRTQWYKEQRFQFPEDRIFEDIVVSVPLHYRANRVAVVRRTGYFWRIRTGTSKSITQQYQMGRPLRDKILSLTDLLSFIDENVTDNTYEIRRCVLEKMLVLDFIDPIRDLIRQPAPQAMDMLHMISVFYHQVFSSAAVSDELRVSVCTRQIMKDVMDEDLDHLRRMMNYQKYNYGNVPVVEEGDGLKLILPDRLFTLPGRSALHEFGNTPPRCMIDKVLRNGESVEIYGHLYVRRIDLSEENAQEISAYLLNEETGAAAELETRPCRSEFLTAEQGEVVNYDDYRTYHYNYDHAGFVITLPFSAPSGTVPEGIPEGRNAVMIRYANRIIRGVRILRGVKKAPGELLRKTSLSLRDQIVTFEFDRRDTLFVLCRRV